MAKGLVVLDVDGVVFPNQFVLALARRRGWLAYLMTVLECLLLNLGRLPLEKLLRRTFNRFEGMPWGEVREAYSQMKLSTGTTEAIRKLKDAGLDVVLLSAGAPDALVKDLAKRLNADDGAGIETEVKDGFLTGKVSGELSKSGGKLRLVERIVQEKKLRWRDVVAVGDDPNNLPVMMKSGLSIGYHAAYSVRQRAHVLVEEDDLRLIVEPALGQGKQKYPLLYISGKSRWFREVFRKILHLTAIMVAIVGPFHQMAVTGILVCAMGLYLVLEFWRLNGASLPFVQWVHRLAIRQHESRESAIAPLTLALGVLFALWCLPQNIGLACILITAVADSSAAIIGSRWGRIPWAYNKQKTVEGSSVFFLSALVCSIVYVPMPQALLLAAISTLLESMPLQDWDNFVTPVGTGFIAVLLM